VKQKSVFLVIIILVFLWSTFTQNVFGNPVAYDLPENPFITIPLLIALFFGGVRVECAHFNSKFFKKYNYKYISKDRFKLFLRVNLVTFPLTQILAYFFYLYFTQFFWFYILLIEVGVVLIETYLLRIELRRLVEADIPSRFILRKTTFANITSFLVGFLVYLPTILYNEVLPYLV